MVSGQLQKIQLTSVRSNLEPEIWSRDTGQRIPCFDRCQFGVRCQVSIRCFDSWSVFQSKSKSRSLPRTVKGLGLEEVTPEDKVSHYLFNR